MKFREIILADYENLIHFWGNNYFVNEMDSYERFKLFLEKNPKFSILAEEKGKIIGTALGSFDGRRGYIQKVVVDTNFRKRGLGQKLVIKIIEKLRAQGVLYIPIAVEEEYVSFYKKCGFKTTEQVPMNVEIKHE